MYNNAGGHRFYNGQGGGFGILSDDPYDPMRWADMANSNVPKKKDEIKDTLKQVTGWLLGNDGGGSGGSDGSNNSDNPQSGGKNSNPGLTEVSPGGISFGFDQGKASLGRGALGLALGGPIGGLLGYGMSGLTMSKNAPVFDANPSSVDPRGWENNNYFGDVTYDGNGFTSVGGNFGVSNAPGSRDPNAGTVPGGPEDNQGGYGGGVAGASNGPGAAGTGYGDTAGGFDGYDFYKGGKVTANRLIGHDPKGPDDGFATLDVGEFVITAKRSKELGAKKLQALLDGRADIVMKGKK